MNTQRKRLIFFVGADPEEDPHTLWRAYHFAEAADKEGLESEVRLAGDAVKVGRLDAIPAQGKGAELPALVKQRAASGLLVSL